jgi:hypothetical protein
MTTGPVKLVTQGLRTARVVEVAVGDQQDLNLAGVCASSFDVAQQRLGGVSAAGIGQSRVSIEIQQIDGGIVRSGQFRTAKSGLELVAAELLDRFGEAFGDPALPIRLRLLLVSLGGRLRLVGRPSSLSSVPPKRIGWPNSPPSKKANTDHATDYQREVVQPLAVLGPEFLREPAW